MKRSPGDGDESLTLADLLASDSEDPSIAAARKLDWEATEQDVRATKRQPCCPAESCPRLSSNPPKPNLEWAKSSLCPYKLRISFDQNRAMAAFPVLRFEDVRGCYESFCIGLEWIELCLKNDASDGKHSVNPLG